jgi:predicted deacylase
LASEELRSAWQALAAREDAGVPGTMIQEGLRSGPTVGITMMTHGNEPAGLAAWAALANQKLLQGRVIWVLNNLEAAAAYFALPPAAPLFQRQGTRLVGRNMNRLPADLASADPTISEIRRSLDLLPVWARFDIAMDIHTTSQDAPPMLAVKASTDLALCRGMAVRDVIVGFDAAMRDREVLGFYGTPRGAAHALSIEAGGHEEQASADTAALCVRRLLANLGMLPGSAAEAKRRPSYVVREGLFFPSLDYEMVRVFANFEPVHRGQMLAEGRGAPVLSPRNGHILMCPASRRLTDLGEEAAFISDPVAELVF